MGHDLETAKPVDRRPVLLVALAGALFVATAALYWPACDNEFVDYDDGEYVTGNPEVLDGLRVGSVLWALTASHSSNWHPLTWLSLQLDAELFGTGPRGFHRTNVLLHAANVVLVFLALRALTGCVWRGAAVAALFAVHPQHVESVAWVTERKDVLSAFFFFLAILLYTRYAAAPSARRMIPVGAALALGLAAKPMLVTLPCVLLLLDFWPLGRVPLPERIGRAWVRAWGPLVVEKLPLFALVILSVVLTVGAQDQAIKSLDVVPVPDRITNAIVSYVAYLRQTVYPTDLAVFYPHPGAALPGWQIAGALVVLAGVTGLTVWHARRRPYLLVGWLWYVGMLVPVIGLVQVGEQARADRYMYLPHVGLFVALVWGAAEVIGDRRWGRAAAAGALVAVLVGAGLLTRSQIAVWKDPRTLWYHAVAVTTDNYEAEAHAADADFAAGDKEGAVARVERSLRIHPGKATSEQRVAELLVELGRPAEALAHYREAVRLEPNDTAWRIRLAELLLGAGQLDEAEAEYRALPRTDAKEAAWGLGRVRVRRGQLKEAAALFARALDTRDPNNPDVVLEIGRALAKEDCHEDAAAMYTRALQLRPDDPALLDVLAGGYAQVGRWDEAVATADRAAAAAEKSERPELAARFRSRRDAYKERKPDRQPGAR